jgi:hypothetical protein
MAGNTVYTQQYYDVQAIAAQAAALAPGLQAAAPGTAALITAQGSAYQAQGDAALLMAQSASPELYEAISEVLTFIYSVNLRAEELLQQAERIYAERTVHGGSGDGAPAIPFRSTDE